MPGQRVDLGFGQIDAVLDGLETGYATLRRAGMRRYIAGDGTALYIFGSDSSDDPFHIGSTGPSPYDASSGHGGLGGGTNDHFSESKT